MDFVNVSVRIRPVLSEDTTTSSCLQVISKTPAILSILGRPQTYLFDKIFSEEIDQETVYNDSVQPLVNYVKKGYNCTVFAYGQTGTGKTYTMGTAPQVWDPKDNGLIPRALEEFFAFEDEEIEVGISVSFIEIYNDKVFDLLRNDHPLPLIVKGGKIQGCNQESVENLYEAKQLLEIGNRHRHTGETRQNSNSSRSHAIFTIHCNVRHMNHETTAKLNLVDLAGSESVKKTGNQGSTLHEGININKCLLYIGQVIAALSTNSAFVPYRQSIITTILQDSLNKKNFVSLIACVNSNPEDSNETVQTLEFAQRVKKMKTKPEINELISQYRKDHPCFFTPAPRKRSAFSIQTPRTVKQIKTGETMPIIESNSPRSLFSMSVSSIASEANPAALSPVIKKYMTQMESSIMDRLETVIKKALKRPRSRDKENTSPDFTWSKIQDTVSRMVNAEIAQRVRATSSPIEPGEHANNIRRVLNYESPEKVVFKIPEIPINTKKIQKTTVISPIETEPRQRRSVRLSLKKSTVNDSLQEASLSCCDVQNENPNINRRRSVRIANITKTPTSTMSPYSAHGKSVLKTLNHGKLKDLMRLATIGAKTASQLLLFRQLKGPLENIEDLSKMPGWGQRKVEMFKERNFLKK